MTYDHRVCASRLTVCVFFVIGLTAAACATHVAPRSRGMRTFDTQVDVHERPLTVHVTSDPSRQIDDLLIYVTGDGGWRGKDRDVYTQLQLWGYSVAGFSAPEYLKSLPGEEGTTTPTRLASDFSQIIRDDVMESLSGVKGENSVKIFGPDLSELERLAVEVNYTIGKIPGRLI